MTFNQFTYQILKSHPVYCVIVLVMLLCATVLEIFGLATVFPLLQSLIDGNLTDEGMVSTLLRQSGLIDLPFDYLLVFIGLFMVGRTIMLFLSQFITGVVAARIEKKYRDLLMRNVLSAKWLFFVNQKAGTLSNAIAKETDIIAGSVSSLGKYFTSLILFTIFVTTSVIVSFQSAIFVFAFGIVITLLGRYINKLTRRISVKRVEENNETNAQVIENTQNAKYIKASAIEQNTLQRFYKKTSNLMHLKIKDQLYKAFLLKFPELSSVVVIAVIVFYVYKTNESVTDFLFFILLIQRAYGHLGNLQVFRQNVVATIPSYEIVKSLTDEAASMAEESRKKTFKAFKCIRFDKISYAYGTHKNVIKNLSLEIKPNKKIAFVGKSGAGKTTLVDLLLGLLKPTKGEILIDKDPLSSLNIQSWRQSIAYVPQNPVLFNGSIKDNILRDATQCSDIDFKKILETAHVSEFVSDLPESYNTEVGDNAVRLSGGQKQRVALARALARKPKLLILDEATSALDNHSEKLIHDAIEKLSKNMTILIIAHRLSTVQNADTIYFIENGQISESGAYKDLMKKRGKFYKLSKALAA